MCEGKEIWTEPRTNLSSTASLESCPMLVACDLVSSHVCSRRIHRVSCPTESIRGSSILLLSCVIASHLVLGKPISLSLVLSLARTSLLTHLPAAAAAAAAATSSHYPTVCVCVCVCARVVCFVGDVPLPSPRHLFRPHWDKELRPYY